KKVEELSRKVAEIETIKKQAQSTASNQKSILDKIDRLEKESDQLRKELDNVKKSVATGVPLEEQKPSLGERIERGIEEGKEAIERKADELMGDERRWRPEDLVRGRPEGRLGDYSLNQDEEHKIL